MLRCAIGALPPPAPVDQGRLSEGSTGICLHISLLDVSLLA